MPTYEYRCAGGHHFDQFQRMTDPPLEKCPTCGAAAERLLSAGAGLLFKGSGFYITDYRSDTYKKAAEADSGKTDGKGGEAKASKDGKDGKGGAKSDTKSGSGGKPSSSSGE